MDNIISKLKKTNRYFWFIYKDSKFSLLSQAKTKKESKVIFLKKIINDDSSNIDSSNRASKRASNIDLNKIPIIFGYIKIAKDQNAFTGGPIGLVLQFKRINKKGEIKPAKDDDRTSIVWFSEKYLLEKGFQSSYLLKFLEAVFFRKIKLSVLGTHMYDDLDIS
jgi:hypothetical protein